jgi:hypothetical protein
VAPDSTRFTRWWYHILCYHPPKGFWHSCIWHPSCIILSTTLSLTSLSSLKQWLLLMARQLVVVHFASLVSTLYLSFSDISFSSNQWWGFNLQLSALSCCSCFQLFVSLALSDALYFQEMENTHRVQIDRRSKQTNESCNLFHNLLSLGKRISAHLIMSILL